MTSTRNLLKKQGIFYNSLGTNTSAVVKASRGYILSINCINLSQFTRWFQIYDSLTVPTGGATPLFSYPAPSIPNNLRFDANYLGEEGRQFDTGITWAISTTPAVFTAATASETFVEIRYS